MEGRFGDIVLTARYFYVTALVHLTKDFDDLIYSVSFLFHVSGRVFARQSLIFNGPVCGGQVIFTFSVIVWGYTPEGIAEWKEAVKWYRKAAEQGFAFAQFSLGGMYNFGWGVIEDKVQAYAWLNISAANGDENGKTQKAMVAEEMTKEQIAKAQDLSREIVKANPKLMGD